MSNSQIKIRRSKHQKSFTTLPNDLINDEDIDFAALGVLTYLLSKPVDWTTRAADLQRRGKCGRTKVYDLLKALESAGYVEREQMRNEDGSFASRNLIVNDIKLITDLFFDDDTEQEQEENEISPESAIADAADPSPQNPRTAKPHTVKRTHTKEPLLQKPPKVPQGGFFSENVFKELIKIWPEEGRKGLAIDRLASQWSKKSVEMQEELLSKAPVAIAKLKEPKSSTVISLTKYIRNELCVGLPTFEEFEAERKAAEVTKLQIGSAEWFAHRLWLFTQKGMKFKKKQRTLVGTIDVIVPQKVADLDIQSRNDGFIFAKANEVPASQSYVQIETDGQQWVNWLEFFYHMGWPSPPEPINGKIYVPPKIPDAFTEVVELTSLEPVYSVSRETTGA